MASTINAATSGGGGIIHTADSSGTLTLQGAGTTGLSISSAGATTLSAALTYGGITLSNSVTGTGSMVLSASPTLTGTLTAASATLSGTLTTTVIAETFSAPSISSNVLTINLNNGTVFNVTNNANITTFTISNAPASKSSSFTLVLTANGTGYSQTWGASVNWSGGTAPTLTTTNAKRDIIMFFTNDGGTTWFGTVMGQNF